MWAAFPPSDYYGDSVAVGVAPRRSISRSLDPALDRDLGRPFIPTPGLIVRCPTREPYMGRTEIPTYDGGRPAAQGGAAVASVPAGLVLARPGLGFGQCSPGLVTRVWRGNDSTGLFVPRFTDMLWSPTPFGFR
jgi:hypothetical protein